MSTEAVERTSIWADEAVLLLRILVDEKILQQLDICSKKRIYEKMAKLWIHPFIFSSKKVGDIDSLLGRKRKIFEFSRSVKGTVFAPG